MLDWFVTPQQVPNVVLNAQTRWLPVIAQPYVRRNSSWQLVPGSETAFAASAVGLANAASVNIWTSAAGACIYLTMLSFSSSVAGLIQVAYNGVSIWLNLVVAGTPTHLPISGFGHFLYPVASTLRITNLTGGVSDVRATAWGAEVVG